MARIAFMTFGNLVSPWGDPSVAEFEDRVEGTFAAAAVSDGFIGTDYDPADDTAVAWGPWRRTTLYPGSEEPESETEASTISLWRDLESVRAFAYSGRHLEALRHRSEWFEPARWPTYVAWWVEDDHVPTWDEGYGRLERLHAAGPSPEAFDFRHPFDAMGRPVRLGRPEESAARG
jgi:Domain of unknown function (DUF3291)